MIFPIIKILLQSLDKICAKFAHIFLTASKYLTLNIKTASNFKVNKHMANFCFNKLLDYTCVFGYNCCILGVLWTTDKNIYETFALWHT